MLTGQSMPTSVVIVGAGPYGLSLAAHLRAKGVPFRIFGQPFQSWNGQMRTGMRLQSNGFALNLSTGAGPYTLGQFCRDTQRPYDDTQMPVAVEDFIAYGHEFARRYVPTLETDQVTSIRSVEEGFRVTIATGELIDARRVVIAPGVSLFQQIPADFRHLPAARVTDPSQHGDFKAFAGRDVTVLGRGASALNAAVLLDEAGARVTLITRGRKIRLQEQPSLEGRPLLQRLLRPCTPLGTGLRFLLASSAPGFLHALPPAIRSVLNSKLIEPAGSAALKDRIGLFPVLRGCRIHAIEKADGAGERLRLTLTDGNGRPTQHLTSHLMAGTGYRVDLDRLRFLSSELRDLVRVDSAGAPVLTRTFESSVKGLYMIGPIAAPSFGPLLRFIAGTNFAAGRISLHLQRAWLRERGKVDRPDIMPLGTAAQRHRVL